jgi:hypothetical protein
LINCCQDPSIKIDSIKTTNDAIRQKILQERLRCVCMKVKTRIKEMRFIIITRASTFPILIAARISGNKKVIMTIIKNNAVVVIVRKETVFLNFSILHRL